MGSRAYSIRKPGENRPGVRVSVDLLISAQPGLLAQVSGHITRRRVTCATIFKDHFSNFTHCHLQCSSDHEETLSVKWAIERFAHRCGVDILAHHANNGRFVKQAFRDECAL